MPQPYVGEIKLFAGSYAPVNWAFCDGQIVAISEFEQLFQLIGTTYGGDGQASFALPDLRGRLPVHQGDGSIVGQAAGTETVTLTVTQLPAHIHPLAASADTGTSPTPAGNVFAASGSGNAYRPPLSLTAMAPASVAPTSGGLPHTNLQPHLCVNFIIALFGIYPSPA